MKYVLLGVFALTMAAPVPVFTQAEQKASAPQFLPCSQWKELLEARSGLVERPETATGVRRRGDLYGRCGKRVSCGQARDACGYSGNPAGRII